MSDVRTISAVLGGPDYFCPTCGRWLVRMHADGSAAVAGKAAFDARLELDELEGRALVVDARCLRLRCRFAAWRRR